MKEKLTMIETFSGIGAQVQGFKDSGLYDVEVIATSEIDKDAILSYAIIHCGLTKDLLNTYDFPEVEEMIQYLVDRNIGYDTKKNKPYNWQRVKGMRLRQYYLASILSKNVGDVTKVKELPYADMLTFSFPCQSISISGKQEGIIKGETRSGLVYEIVRLVKTYKEQNNLPKYLLLENVKNLVQKKFINDFENLCQFFDDIGYNVYWKVINGKNCGVPQNRERVFGIFIRKDIDSRQFTFPIPFDNGIRLKDILEDGVDEKYYLSEEIQKRLKLNDRVTSSNIVGTTKPDFRTIGQRDLVYGTDGVIGCLTASDYKQPKQILENVNNENKVIQVGNVVSAGNWDNPQRGRIYSPKGCSPTLNCVGGGGLEPKIVCEQRCDEGVRFFKGDYVGILRTIDSCGDKRVIEYDNENSNYVVRKLTPRECFKLMGFKEEHVTKCIEWGLSDSALYRQAGNSIITNCIKLIAEHLHKAQYNNTYVCEDENFTQPQTS